MAALDSLAGPSRLGRVEVLVRSCGASVYRSSSSRPVFAVVPAGDCIQLVGELDIAGVPHLRAALHKMDGKDIVLDCSTLTFVDCAGLGVLIAAHHRCADAGLQLTLRAPSRCLMRLLELTGVDALFVLRASSSES